MNQGVWLLGTLLASAATVDAVAEEFVFGWKPGMSCRVRNSMQKGHVAPIVLSYTLKTTAGPDGRLVIEASDPRLDGPGVTGSNEERSQTAQQLTAVNMPTFQVDPEGNLIGLLDPEGAQKKLRELFAANMPDTKARERALQLVATKELLESVVGLLWTPAVQMWAGGSLDMNERASSTIESVLPIGGVPVTMNITYEHAGKSSCGADSKRECVKLVVDQSPEPSSFEKAVVELASKFGASLEGAKIEKVDVRIHTETVTDPTTLIPTSVLFEKKADVRIVEKGKPGDRSSYERREWTFSCL